MEQGDCPDTDSTLLQQGISNSQGKVEGFCQETDFALDQYGIASKEGKVASFGNVSVWFLTIYKPHNVRNFP